MKKLVGTVDSLNINYSEQIKVFLREVGGSFYTAVLSSKKTLVFLPTESTAIYMLEEGNCNRQEEHRYACLVVFPGETRILKIDGYGEASLMFSTIDESRNRDNTLLENVADHILDFITRPDVDVIKFIKYIDGLKADNSDFII